MKRIASVVLMLLMLLTAIPMLALPSMAEGASDASEGTDPMSLYVTEDMTLWLDALDPTEPSVDLASGEWHSRVGDGKAYLLGTNDIAWRRASTGGIYYRISTVEEYATQKKNVGMVLPADALSDEDFAVEIVFAPQYISTLDGEIIPHDNGNDPTGRWKWGVHSGPRSSFAVGGFQGCFFQPSVYHNGTKLSGNSMALRAFYYKSSWDDCSSKVTNGNYKPFGTYTATDEGVISDNALKTPFRMTINRTVESDVGLAYRPTVFDVSVGSVRFNVTNGNGSTIGSAEGKTMDHDFFLLSEMSNPFELFFGFPATVYFVRAYRRNLTEAEMEQNMFADLVRYYGADLSHYGALPDEVKGDLHARAAALGYTLSRVELETMIEDAYRVYEEQRQKEEQAAKDREQALAALKGQSLDRYDRYYVKEGLLIFLDGFVSYGEWNTNIDLAGGVWHSKVGNVTATLDGAEYWKEGEGGRGVGYRFTKDAYAASLLDGVCPAAIVFDPALLPNSFTIETVSAMIGLTNSDGTRYVDRQPGAAKYGIYTANYSAFSFGAIKAMAFLCQSEGESAWGVGLDMRWCQTAAEWKDHNGKSGYVRDSYMREVDTTVPTAYTIVKLSPNASTTVLTIYGNMNTKPRVSERYNTLPDSEPEFHLFRGLASTVYAVRVYNRALSLTEQAQNHMADLLSYYRLDTTLLDILLASMEDASSLYPRFNDMGFDLTTAEAESLFREKLSTALMTYMGLSARVDNKIALRAEFEINETALAMLRDEAGYSIEVGALLNFGTQKPTVENAAYRAVFLSDDGVRNDGYYLYFDKGGYSRAALAVSFVSPTPEICSLALRYAYYLILTDAEGRTTTLVGECTSENYDNSIVSYYGYLEKGAYAEDAFVNRVVDCSYEYVEIFVDSEKGSDDGDFRKDALATLGRAYEVVEELLHTRGVPLDLTITLLEGEHRLYEKLALDASDPEILAPFRLTLAGEGDESVLSSTVSFTGLTPVSGTPYYEYQFPADNEGNYPTFRFLYVNGELQTVATNGYSRSYDAEMAGGIENMWRVPYDFIGVDTDDEVSVYKLYLHRDALENITDEDLASGKVEFHATFGWYYRVLHIDGVDFNDTKEDGKYVAAIFRAEEFDAWTGKYHFGGQYYWLENASGFVDDEGEYFYDSQTGRLLYYPAEDVDMECATFAYPTTGHMLSFYSISDLTLRDFTLTGNDNLMMEYTSYIGQQARTSDGDYGKNTLSAVYLLNTNGVTIENCLFHNISTSAVKFEGVTKNARMLSNRFFKIGCTAMDIGTHSGEWDESVNANYNIEIYDNYLDDIAWFTRGSVGIWVGVVKEVEIHYNTIFNTSYSAVSIGWRWSPATWSFGDNWHVYHADIHHNYFSGFMSDQSDGGAVYTLGGNVEESYHELFNYLHENFVWFNEKTWDGKGMVMPLYHDGGSSNWHTYNNVEMLHPSRKVHTPIFYQSIEEQRAHNIHASGNEICGIFKDAETYFETMGEWLEGDALEYAIFNQDPNGARLPDGSRPTRVDATRFLSQSDNHAYDDPYEMSFMGYVLDMIDEAGSSYAKPVADDIIEEMQPLYEQRYEEMIEEWLKAP